MCYILTDIDEITQDSNGHLKILLQLLFVNSLINFICLVYERMSES